MITSKNIGILLNLIKNFKKNNDLYLLIKNFTLGMLYIKEHPIFLVILNY